jgi:NDP-sugar pyrophosphorylase family protein
MRKDFVYAKNTDQKETVLQLMQEHRIECMPILDENLQLVTIYLWDDLLGLKKRNDGIQLNLPVVIMAGGQGNRLKPLTNILPKPLIPIGEKTIIEQIMDKFCDAGCNTFFLSVNYKAEMIKYYFSTLENNVYKISYLEEDKPLGTAGSLHLLKGKINSTFFVSNCDILIDQEVSDIYEYHKAARNEITLVAALKNYSIPYGILETTREGLLQSITEKPELTFKINTGLYILEPHLINEIPENEFYHITSLIGKLQKEKRKVGVFPVSEKSWRDIGDWDVYEKLLH